MSRRTADRPAQPWLLVGSAGMFAADCMIPGCLWTCTTSNPESADRQAFSHASHEHWEVL
ncbi:hypothetical protein LWF15_02965 [Kineosporia rhizophila]|uniref:hypothetical protein n=1 Tax=Kineosporia TaxID=49184 RepID=UPI001E3A19BF|nr:MULTISPECIES: hypothetical protein [Kineosporia]MCE0534459.1 hypothetical protein [Kineosporia rhizophila]GLY13993.1 hypothetical protein Kisp01_10090 [Kineosporia sp. NBRC 101677]